MPSSKKYTKRKKKNIPKVKSFLHFGCWNQGLCDMVNNNNPLSNVMYTIDNYIDNMDIDFLCIAGDNYYPKKNKINKEEKIKRIYDKDLKSGFDCLPENKDIYMLLGNHDLETNNKSKNNIFLEDTDTPESGCYILNKELEYSDNHNPPIHFVFNHSKLIDKTLIIMIDSSLYMKDAEELMECYNLLLSRNLRSIEDIIKIQSLFVLNTIKKNIGKFTNLVLIGHHPITGNKIKKGIKLIKPFLEFINLFLDIYNILGDEINYNYLCADLHLYQEGIIKIDNMIIQQYIVGTGGTKLDDNSKVFPEFSEIEVKNHNIKYQMFNSIKKHGFLHCQIYGEHFDCAFVEAINRNIDGGNKLYNF
jgi:hypothetical protein